MNLAALGVGVLFGLGLAISGMLNPAKVFAFLDITGAWDPTLAVVMAAGLGVNAVAYRLTMRRAAPVLAQDATHGWPERSAVPVHPALAPQ